MRPEIHAFLLIRFLFCPVVLFLMVRRKNPGYTSAAERAIVTNAINEAREIREQQGRPLFSPEELKRIQQVKAAKAAAQVAKEQKRKRTRHRK